MATVATMQQIPFSLGNFQKLFGGSAARKYLTRYEVDQIREAIEKKNLALLEKLYFVLLDERATDEELTRHFVIEKNRIMNDYMFGVKEIKKIYIEKPRKARASKVEETEKARAEKILKNL
jgi:hypothetical protein